MGKIAVSDSPSSWMASLLRSLDVVCSNRLLQRVQDLEGLSDTSGKKV